MLTKPPTDHESVDGKREDHGAVLVRERLIEHLGHEVDEAGAPSTIDARLAGSWGSRLGLVEERDDGVRFHHSVLQAFLASQSMGSLVLGEAAADEPAQEPSGPLAFAEVHGALRARTLTGRRWQAPLDEEVRTAYFDTALKCPGRELGLALVFYSRSEPALAWCQADCSPAATAAGGSCPIGIVRNRLVDSANRAALEGSPVNTDNYLGSARVDSGDVEQDPRIRALEMYSAALDIDSFHHQPKHRAIVQDIKQRWDDLQEYNERVLDAPKKALVRRWLEKTGTGDHRRTVRHEHPLVEAAGTMARRALQSRRPDRFLWIDEAGMASHIGSETSSPREPRLHNLWIPPSRGWSTLDPGAQQLLGDVLVLLALAEERGDRAEDARLRLKHADRTDPPLLPPCLAHDRAPLVPARALVTEESRSLPGSNCADGCPFELCPYPPKGPQCRTELNEAFCIHQRALLNRMQPQAWRFLRFRRRAPWQRKTSVASLRKFWDDMGSRDRNQSVSESSRRHLDRR